MITNRQLKATFTGALRTQYRRTDIELSPNTNKGDIEYNEFKFDWLNGSGRERVDMQYAERLTLNNSVLILDLDGGLENLWGDQLNFDSIKAIIINNLTEETGAFIDARFKDDRYYIGSGGTRIILEPWGAGLSSIVSSSSSDEGSLILSSNYAVQFDLIILGSSQEQSSSSSGL